MPIPSGANAPAEECDLVLKGGITSGVVYPSLLRKLALRYTFRSIGGTSAGAIAAAAAAAAEYGRGSGAVGAESGFDGLGRMQSELAGLDPDSGAVTDRRFLLNLFKPAPALADVFGFALSVYTGLMRRADKWRKRGEAPDRTALGVLPVLLGAVIRHFPVRSGIAIVLGILVPLAAAVLLGASAAGVPGFAAIVGGVFVLATLAATCAFAAAALVGWRLVRALNRDLPAGLFGLCTGRAGEALDPKVLTDWLYVWLNKLAGLPLDSPLTFEHLAAHTFAHLPAPANVGIRLRMVTSNLTQRIPHLLPFRDELFLYREAEFARLFPPQVMAYLARCEAGHPLHRGVTLPAGVRFLPQGDCLPVIVATRMSLSFPVLLSAVPLYSLAPDILRAMRDRGADATPVTVGPEALQRHWLSDGGLCSNFPIHFFDDWAPSHPTFGVNLSSLEANQIAARLRTGTGDGADAPRYQASPQMMSADATRRTRQTAVDGALVFLQRADAEPLLEFRPFERADGTPAVFEFFASILGTASDFRDTLQAIQPGYRERIVQIRLAADEGGLNLDMDRDQLERLFTRGEWAAAALLDEFSWDDHKWVRLRVLLGHLEARILQLWNGLPPPDALDLPGPGSTRPYPIDDPADPLGADIARAEVRHRVASLAAAVQSWGMNREPVLYDAPQRPKPDGVLRITPEF